MCAVLMSVGRGAKGSTEKATALSQCAGDALLPWARNDAREYVLPSQWAAQIVQAMLGNQAGQQARETESRWIESGLGVWRDRHDMRICYPTVRRLFELETIP